MYTDTNVLAPRPKYTSPEGAKEFRSNCFQLANLRIYLPGNSSHHAVGPASRSQTHLQLLALQRNGPILRPDQTLPSCQVVLLELPLQPH